VLRNGRLSKSNFLHDIIADTTLLPAQVLQDGDTGGVSQDPENICQVVLLLIENLCLG
jgi:hypothetical protein